MTKRKEELAVSNNNKHNHYINNPIREEIRSLQKSIALLRQDIRKIVREEVEGAVQRN
jgi:hypothetical protein